MCGWWNVQWLEIGNRKADFQFQLPSLYSQCKYLWEINEILEQVSLVLQKFLDEVEDEDFFHCDPSTSKRYTFF